MTKQPKTPTQQEALDWLRQHQGSGAIDKFGRVIAAGERSKFEPITWLRLMTDNFIEPDGYLRIRVTK